MNIQSILSGKLVPPGGFHPSQGTHSNPNWFWETLGRLNFSKTLNSLHLVMVLVYAVLQSQGQAQEIPKEVISREASLFVINGSADSYAQLVSREVSLAVVTPEAPPQITDFDIANSPTGDRVVLSWGSYNQWAVKDIARFDIYLTDHPFTEVTGMTPILSAPGESQTATITNLPTLRDHFLAIVAVDALGNYNPSVIYSAAYILSPQVISREVSLFVVNGSEDPYAQVVSREVSVFVSDPIDPPPGLLAWWPGEDTAFDFEGTNHGTIMGGTSFDRAYVGEGFQFREATDYTLLPDVTRGLPEGTVEGWFLARRWNPSSTPAGIYFWAATQELPGGLQGYDGISLGSHPPASATGELMFGIFDTNAPSARWHWAKSGMVPETNRWYHIAGSWGAQGVRIYVDGQLMGTNAYAGPAPSYTRHGIMGRSSWPDSSALSQIDELKVFNRALAPGEVAAIFNAGAAGIDKTLTPPYFLQQPESITAKTSHEATFTVRANGAAPLAYQWFFRNGTNPLTNAAAWRIIAAATSSTLHFPALDLTNAGSYYVQVSNTLGVIASRVAMLTVTNPVCVPPPSGLVGWWPGDGNANDLVGSNHGTLQNGAAYAIGKAGQAFNLDGFNDYVDLGASPSLNFVNSSFTAMAWIYLTGSSDNSNDEGIMSRYSISGGSWILGRFRDGKVWFGLDTDGGWALERSVWAAQVTSTGAWHHVAGAYNHSTGTLRLYVDGQSSGTNNGPPVTIYQNFGSKVSIGNWYSYDGFNGSTALKGLIDEAALFTSALQPEEIAAIYAAGSAGMCKPLIPPSIVAQPTNVMAFATMLATFRVQAVGDEPLRYQWRFNGGALAGGTNATLVFPSTQPSLAGAYDVVVSNPLGSVTSVVATLTVRTDIPDLAVRNLSLPPNALAGQPVPLVFTVTNQGTATASSPWLNAVFLATNANGDGALPVGTFPQAISLAAGASVTLTQTVILPSGTFGTRFVGLTADSANQLFETNKANNTLVSSASIVITAPDLEVSLLTSPATGVFGELINVTWAVRNAGTGSTYANWSDRLFLSTNSGSIIGATPLISVATPVSPLAPGASYTNTSSIRLPFGAQYPTGLYHLVLVADADNSQPESNEANNQASRAFSLTLPPLPDLKAGHVSTVALSSPGQTIAVTWNVTNRGPAIATGPWSEIIRIVADEVTRLTNSAQVQNLLTSAPTLGTFAYSSSLAPGEFLARTQFVTLPVSGVSGDTRLVVTVDARGEVLEENETNNVTLAGNVLTIPVSLTLQLSSSQISENATAPLRATLTRNGSLAQALTVRVTNSDPSELSFVQSLLTSATTNITIPAGQSVVVFNLYALADQVVDANQAVTLTASVPGYDSASADVTVLNVDLPTLTLSAVTNGVTEGFTAGMTVTRDVVTSNALIVTLSSSSPGQLSPPNFVTIPAGSNSVTFAVLAVDDANAEDSAAYFISASAAAFNSAVSSVTVLDNDVPQLTVSLSAHSVSEGSGAQALSMTVTREPVGAGALNIEPTADDASLVTLPLRITIPPGQASRSFPVGVFDDTQVNGSRSVVLTAYALAGGTGQRLVEAIPDVITVTDDDGPTLKLVAALKLIREGQNPATTVTVTRNTPATNNLVVSLTSIRTNEAIVPATIILSNGQASVSFNLISIPDGTNDGNQTVTLTAMALNFTPGTETVVVSDTDLPDLSVSSITAPASAVPQQRVGIGYRVVNQGLSTTAGEFLTRVYLSRDAVVGGDDVLVAQFRNTNAVAVGQFIESTEQIELPLAVGNYWVVVETDAEQTLGEVLEDNNTRISALPIAVAADYAAWVQADLLSTNAGTAVPLYGRATNSLGAPVAGKSVSLHVLVRGTQRILSATTDSDGNFSTIFTPLPSEAGRYDVFATHPGVSTVPVQDTFSLLGFRAIPASVSVTVVESLSRSGSLTLENLSDVPLTGLAVQVISKPANLQVTASVGDSQLSTQTPLNYSFTATTSDAYGTVQLRVTTTEGVSQDIYFGVSVEPLRPRLVATPVSLYAAMPVGGQAVVEFDLANLGGRDSGPITVSLPAVPWMHIATTNPMPSLAPGQTNRVTLVLTPTNTLPLGPYTGSLAISADNSGTSVPFNFRAMSESVGSLLVDVVDEFTYYAEGAPHLAGATVTVRDSVTQASVTNGVTGIDGSFAVTNLNEGYYDIEVTADKHTTYRATHLLKAGITNEVQTFVSRQTVTYTWTVEPVTLEDRYKITIETTFEANVPSPVVVVEPSVIDLSNWDRSPRYVELKVSNYGLIAVQNTRLAIPNHPLLAITTPTTDVGVLPARSSFVLPLLIEWRGDSDAQIHAAAASPPPCQLQIDFIGSYVCGTNRVKLDYPIPVVSISKGCERPNPPGGGGIPEGDGEFEKSETPGPAVASGPAVKVAGGTTCAACYENAFWSCAVSIVKSFGKLAWKCNTKFLDCYCKYGGGPVDKPPAVEEGLRLYCLYKDLTRPPVLQAASAVPLNVGEDLPTYLQPFFRWAVLASSDIVMFQILIGPDHHIMNNVAQDVEVPEFIALFAKAILESSADGERISDVEQAALLSSARMTGLTDTDFVRLVDRWNRSQEYWASGILSVDTAPLGNNPDFLAKAAWDEVSTYWNSAILESRAAGFETPGHAAWLLAQPVVRPSSEGGVCARVKLRLEQDAVLTRDAFRATLELDNNGASRLENVRVDVNIRPESGNTDTNLFAVRLEGMPTVLSAIDGTGILAGNSTGTAKWLIIPTVDAAPTVATRFFVGGTLSYRLDGNDVTVPLSEVPITVLPSPRLALKYFHQRDVFSDDPFTDRIEPTDPYSLAVMVQNRGYGQAKNFRITSAQPKIIENEKGLLIDFNIIATEVFKAGTNYGLTPSLTANFGDISAGDTAISRWLLTSTLQGLFIDYSARFEHIDGLGNSRLSLIDEVTIHEMNHLVQAGGIWEDGKPDFLVNEVPDIRDLPDTLYQSNGSTNHVETVEQSSVTGTLSPGNLQVTLTAPMPGDWVYLRVPNPGNGQYRLTRVTRSDGTNISINTNVWTTDRTLIGLSQRPRVENILHLLDYNSTGSYNLTYEPGSDIIIDPLPPVSSVNPLPSSSREYFQVSWSGRDEGLLGQPLAGIAYYDIFVSVNSGTFTNWLPRTTLVSATYIGTTGSRYAFYSVATDANGNRESTPGTPDTETLVNLTNSPPSITISNIVVINEGQTLDLPFAVNDADTEQLLSVSLTGNPPPGVQLSSTPRRLTWTTGEGNGPTTNLLTLVVNDDGFPSLSATGRVTVIVREVNSPPSLDAIPTFKISEGQTLTHNVRASDFDLPAQSLTFSLGAGAPSGAAISATSGVFTWRPSDIQGGTTNRISVIVQDGGTPSLSATQTFDVLVRNSSPDFIFSIGTTNVLAGQDGEVRLHLRSGLELTSLSLRVVPDKGSLTSFGLESVASELSGATLVPDGTNGVRVNLTAAPGQLLPSDGVLANLLFDAPPQEHSSIVSLPVNDLRGTLANGTVLSNGRGNGGRVFVIGAEPLLDAVAGANSTRSLVLYGQPGEAYEIQATTILDGSPIWQPVRALELTDTFDIWTAVPGQGSPVYYRAVQLASPDAVRIGGVSQLADGRMQFQFGGIANRLYVIEASTNLVNWLPLATNRAPIQFTIPIGPTPTNRFFRVRLAGVCSPPPGGLVAWWPGDGNARDYIGTNHGVMLNGAGFAAGKVGSGFRFDGVDDYINVGRAPVLQFEGTSPFSFSFWIAPEFTGSPADIITRYNVGVGVAWELYTSQYNDVGFWTRAVAEPQELTSTPLVPYGSFTHVVMSFDGSTKRIFLNGALNASLASAPIAPFNSENTDVLIGVRRILDQPYFPNAYKGVIDEVMVFNHALTENEILRLYSVGEAGFCMPAEAE